MLRYKKPEARHAPRPGVLAASLMGAGLFLAACSSGGAPAGSTDEATSKIPGISAELIRAAQDEGELSLYRLGYDFPASVFPEFRRLFPGITIKDFNATAGALVERYSSEARNGIAAADVVMTADPNAVRSLDREGLITRYAPRNSDAFLGGSIDQLAYPFSQIRLCTAYNADRVSDATAERLREWDGITDPQWREKGGIVRLGAGGAAFLPYAFMTENRDSKLFETMLADQRPMVFANLSTMTERLASGGLDVVFFANDGNLHSLYKKGAPVRWKCPSPGLSVYNLQFIAAKAPNPNAAKLWTEFITSEYGQGLVTSTLGMGPVVKGVKDDRPAVQEPWYVAPTEEFTFDWTRAGELLPGLQQRWEAAAKGLSVDG